MRNTDSASACCPAAPSVVTRLACTGSWNGAIDAASCNGGSTRSGRPSDTASSAAATHASRNSSSSAAKIGIAAGRELSPSPAGPLPEAERLHVAVERRSWRCSREGGPGRLDELPEGDEVQRAGAGGEQVPVAAALQVASRLPGPGASGSSNRRSAPTYLWMTLSALAGTSSSQIRSISSLVLIGRPTRASSSASRYACCRGPASSSTPSRHSRNGPRICRRREPPSADAATR